MAKVLPTKLKQSIEAQVKQAAQDRQLDLQLKKEAEDKAANTSPAVDLDRELGVPASDHSPQLLADIVILDGLNERLSLVRHGDGQHIVAIRLSLVEYSILSGVAIAGVLIWWGWCYRRK